MCSTPKPNGDVAIEILRHKTAIGRGALSGPVRLLYEGGLASEDNSFLDYGCGRGDDVKFLSELGILAQGWDPYFANNPEILKTSDIVNVGFVINVIEDPDERLEVLKSAYKLAKKCLSVAVMLPAQNDASHIIPFRDGHVTSTKTFQKYYEQNEIAELLKNTLPNSPIAAAPGIFFIFKDEKTEQDYLLKRQLGIIRDYDPERLITKRAEKAAKEQATLEEKQRKQAESLAKLKEAERLAKTVAKHTLAFARKPELDELPKYFQMQLQESGLTYRKVFSAASQLFTEEDLREAIQIKKEKLLLFFAMYFFSGRPKYKQLSASLQKDIRLHFGAMTSIEKEAKDFLFSLGDDDLLLADCVSVVSDNLGYMDDDKLILKGTSTAKLPLRLRGILSVSNRISGEIENTDIVKIHLGSKKVTYLGVDDFKNSPLPRITKRTVVDLRVNSVFTVSHDDKGRVRIFYLKSRLMDKSDKNFEIQSQFDNQVANGSGLSFAGEGPKFEDFAKKLMELKIVLPSYQ